VLAVSAGLISVLYAMLTTVLSAVLSAMGATVLSAARANRALLRNTARGRPHSPHIVHILGIRCSIRHGSRRNTDSSAGRGRQPCGQQPEPPDLHSQQRGSPSPQLLLRGQP
jgi:hypothetical protein